MYFQSTAAQATGNNGEPKMRPQLAYAGIMLSVYCALVYGFRTGTPTSPSTDETKLIAEPPVAPEEGTVSSSASLTAGKFNSHDSWMPSPVTRHADPSHRAAQAPSRAPAPNGRPQASPTLVNGAHIIPNDFTANLNQNFYRRPDVPFTPTMQHNQTLNRVVTRVRW
jgi:hypothetical protein